MALSAIIERSATPLDQVRRAWFALILRSRVGSVLVQRRDLRVATIAALHAGFAFFAALYLPMLLFVLGPILLGVVHVAADVRYLVLRQRLASWWRSVLLGSCVLLLGLRVLEETKLVAHAASLEGLIAA